ncbi:hypothetical protein DACRYDRAFT_108171 [Dacryopinax primogenitus]|uniref:Concanavalin A-like lectin/glucanase n=1 Tax=Dacryopinax primogenitus (strain DJM 731) TaxID=1858805 RepID=M5GC78_DACPD|nr:uncharacterized protein DACRYDRAFT_108171 [Dacryopinax primogenitus]EJU01638.1 hypothetical protein DACRYDRAFT_108171 [Dacryopinax primogenitus]
MRALFSLAAFAVFVRSVTAISWALIFDNGNTWIEQVFTIHVPPAPPADVTTGPWYFWCGLQPTGGGVVQPVLAFLGPEGNQVNPNPPFPEVYAMNLWALPWNIDEGGAPPTQESAGIWVDQGAQIASSVSFQGSQWVQSANVISGAASGQSVTLNTPDSYFQNTSPGNDNTMMTVCESELYGSQIGEWDFSVTFTDVFFRAASSNGVEALCQTATDHTDGNGFISFTGFSMFDEETCFWSSITLTPP